MSYGVEFITLKEARKFYKWLSQFDFSYNNPSKDDKMWSYQSDGSIEGQTKGVRYVDIHHDGFYASEADFYQMYKQVKGV